jgi:hypothetical protein
MLHLPTHSVLLATVIGWWQWAVLLLPISADLFRVLVPMLAAVLVWFLIVVFLIVHDVSP